MKFEDLWGHVCEDSYIQKKENTFFYVRDDGFTSREVSTKWIEGKVDANEMEYLCMAKGELLDLGCGFGKYGRYLLEGKYIDKVDYVDIGSSVKYFRDRGERLITQDMREYLENTKKRYDTILLMRNVVAECGSIHGVYNLLEACYKVLNNNGIAIITYKDYTKTDEMIHLIYHRNNINNDRYAGIVNVCLHYNEKVSEYKQLCYLSREHLEGMCQEIGFDIILSGKNTWDFCVLFRGNERCR